MEMVNVVNISCKFSRLPVVFDFARSRFIHDINCVNFPYLSNAIIQLSNALKCAVQLAQFLTSIFYTIADCTKNAQTAKFKAKIAKNSSFCKKIKLQDFSSTLLTTHSIYAIIKTRTFVLLAIFSTAKSPR
jgi:hypothetical protein